MMYMNTGARMLSGDGGGKMSAEEWRKANPKWVAKDGEERKSDSKVTCMSGYILHIHFCLCTHVRINE